MTRDLPIIFSAPMIRALLEGRKTMTRRLAWQKAHRKANEPATRASTWTRVQPGDRIWCRENIRLISQGPNTTIGINYRADGDMGNVHFFDVNQHKLKRIGTTPCIHMPRWASRITLIVTAVKREPLQAISEKDATAEGCIEDWADGLPVWYVAGAGMPRHMPTGAKCFRWLFESLHGPEVWNANPEVVALTFRVIKANIDAPEAKAP